MLFSLTKNTKGVTLLEVIVALGIFSVLAIGGTAMFLSAFRTNRVVWDQLSGQTDARKVLTQIIDDVRRAEDSSVGAYAVELASSSTLIFYANIDNNSFRERVRYWLQGTNLYKGVISPTGTPIAYVTSTEMVTVIAHDVVNTEHNIPVFSYYDQFYTGTEAPIASPVPVTDVRLVQIRLEIDINPVLSPVPLHIEGLANMRTLKTN